MPAHSAPYWLRPIHRWFFWWEVVVPSIYRVVAVAVGAAATAAMLVAVGLHPLVGAPVALVVWIALAVAQEHDERVELPVDADFHRHLRDLVDPVLIAHGLTFSHAFGPCRARDDRTDAFLYERSDASEGCIDLWLHRNQAHGTMRVDFGGRGLSQSLFRTGDVQLAERVGQALSQLDDVTALRAALAAAPKDFWQ